MKKVMVLLVIGICLSPPVFKASNRATIEKHDPGGGDLSGADLILVIDDMPTFSQDYVRIIKMDALVPPSIEIEPSPAVYSAWKPFGEVNTKYHAAWLFHPLKLC